MTIRIFDVVGALTVVAWVALVGMYVFEVNDEPADVELTASEDVVFTEGDTWMLLRPGDDPNREIGYVHERRTAIEDGWLFEYDMFLVASMLGSRRTLQSNLKATLDEDGYLRKFVTTLDTSGRHFSIDGTVSDKTIDMKMKLGEIPREQSLELDRPPRLSANAINAILASEELEPGRRFRQEFFDPTSFGVKEIVYEYVGRKEVTLYDDKIEGHHFRQIVAGTQLDVYVDDEAEVLIQEFPMRILGSRVRSELGRARARKIREQFEGAAGDSDDPTDGTADLSVSTALQMLGSSLSDRERGEAMARVPDGLPAYVIAKIPEGLTLDLNSGRQLVVDRRNASATVVIREVERAHRLDASQRRELLAVTPRVDHDSEAIAELVEGIDVDAAPRERARAVARSVEAKMEPTAEIGIEAASSAARRGRGDCTEYALVTAAALRAVGLPTRFVFGIIDQGDRLGAHQWVQYHDGTRFVDLDVTMDAVLDWLPGPRHLQLVVAPEPNDDRFLSALNTLEIDPLTRVEVRERDERSDTGTSDRAAGEVGDGASPPSGSARPDAGGAVEAPPEPRDTGDDGP